MSAALQLPVTWQADPPQPGWEAGCTTWGEEVPAGSSPASAPQPSVSLAFYRKHTERMLRRYLYSSMQVGRAPSIFGDSVGRGWASSRPLHTFEDAVIFVLDMEKCLARINPLDRQMLSRVVLQEYTYTEAAALLGMSMRAIAYKFPLAIDRLTDLLLDSGMLVLPS